MLSTISTKPMISLYIRSFEGFPHPTEDNIVMLTKR